MAIQQHAFRSLELSRIFSVRYRHNGQAAFPCRTFYDVHVHCVVPAVVAFICFQVPTSYRILRCPMFALCRRILLVQKIRNFTKKILCDKIFYRTYSCMLRIFNLMTRISNVSKIIHIFFFFSPILLQKTLWYTTNHVSSLISSN